MTLTQFWESLDTAKKDQLRIAMSEKCGKSIDTIKAWMRGYRKPSRLESEALCEYIRVNFNVEIAEETIALACDECQVKQNPPCEKQIPCCRCGEPKCNSRQPCPKQAVDQ